jgi:hypothetical protein
MAEILATVNRSLMLRYGLKWQYPPDCRISGQNRVLKGTTLRACAAEVIEEPYLR